MTIKLRNKIKVLLVDDSAIVRRILNAELSRYRNIEVVGTAIDPFVARNKINALNPDVLVLDVEMPRMDGITFLRELMKQHPMPVIMLSSLTPEGGMKAMEAFNAGAIEVMCKPGPSDSIGQVCDILVEKIQAASKARISHKAFQAENKTTGIKHNKIEANGRIFAIGASTGGVQALPQILSALPSDFPATLVVQHMPPYFTASFAQSLDKMCAMKVREAQKGEEVTAGKVLIAPGGLHMLLRLSSRGYHVVIKDGPTVCQQRPSVDVLFNSVAKYAGPNAMGVLLTGMGSDGARGLLNMCENGAHSVAQDESSCVVFGMPREAIKLGAAKKVLGLCDIASEMIQFAESPVLV